jgi:hypothetical protein
MDRTTRWPSSRRHRQTDHVHLQIPNLLSQHGSGKICEQFDASHFSLHGISNRSTQAPASHSATAPSGAGSHGVQLSSEQPNCGEGDAQVPRIPESPTANGAVQHFSPGAQSLEVEQPGSASGSPPASISEEASMYVLSRPVSLEQPNAMSANPTQPAVLKTNLGGSLPFVSRQPARCQQEFSQTKFHAQFADLLRSTHTPQIPVFRPLEGCALESVGKV